MIKHICTICGYTFEGETPPEFCPQCSAPANKFQILDQKDKSLPDEHRVGVAEGIDPEIIQSLRDEFEDECLSVGLYMAMARQADREGYPEISSTFQRVAMEEANHAGRLAELLGEMLFADTQKNLELRADAEFNASDNKKKIASISKQLNLDAVHDATHEMAKDEARHYKMFKGLLERFFS